jgi:hypothetical protein
MKIGEVIALPTGDLDFNGRFNPNRSMRRKKLTVENKPISSCTHLHPICTLGPHEKKRTQEFLLSP